MLNNDENKDFNEDDDLRILFNRNSNEKIAEIRIANTFLKRFLGLMLKRKCDYPLLFEIPKSIRIKERSSIHSLFMRFELKLVFIDDENKVFEIADLKPWSYYVPKKAAKYIIEFDKKDFEKNEFGNYGLKIGDEIELNKKIELKK